MNTLYDDSVHKGQHRHRRRDDEFDAAKISREKFHAAAFTLQHRQLQQRRIEGTLASDPQPSAQALPQRVENLTAGSHRVSKKILGSNLLDSFALLFSRPHARDVIATAMERITTKENTFVLHVAKNDGHYCDHLPMRGVKIVLENWFLNKNLLGVKIRARGTNVDKADTNNPYWRFILAECSESIFKSIDGQLGINGTEKKRQEQKTTLAKFRDVVKNRTKGKGSKQKSNDDGRKEAAELLSAVVDGFETYLDNPRLTREASLVISKNGEIGPSHPPKHLLQQQIDFLCRVTTSCFHALELLEAHRELVEDLRTGSGTGKILRLVFTLAKYCRAWYDMALFKLSHQPINISINFLGCPAPAGSAYALTCIDDELRQMANSAKTAHWLSVRYSSVQWPPTFEDPNEDTQDHQFLDCPYGELRKPEDFPPQWPPDKKACDDCWFAMLAAKKGQIWIPTIVHCEMRMLEKLLSSSDRSVFFDYIGCSKGPCWLCYHTLTNMTTQFKMREPHLKIYAAWEPPSFNDNQANRERCIEVLKGLNNEVMRLNTPKLEPREILPDCPDDDQFDSPRTEEMRRWDKDPKTIGERNGKIPQLDIQGVPEDGTTCPHGYPLLD
ncbi:hypothetical protein F5B20DRAFT_593511 [Whalleya microplaca]|nr:hypothetical protein F5B20DRAFT_593511 [Whalleya microplaca]